jgi:hypothetical protein
MNGFLTYLVPYLPVTPTFLVLFVILADVAVMNGVESWRGLSMLILHVQILLWLAKSVP